MKQKTLIFLKPFSLKNPTLDQHNEYMMRSNVNEVECAGLGRIFNNDDLYGQDLSEFITKKVAKFRPEWVVAEDKCATVVLKMQGPNKVLLNPKVTTDDLNNVSEQARRDTVAFFDSKHEVDYERFLTVYPHAAFFPEDDDLILFTIKEIVQEIFESGQW